MVRWPIPANRVVMESDARPFEMTSDAAADPEAAAARPGSAIAPPPSREPAPASRRLGGTAPTVDVPRRPDTPFAKEPSRIEISRLARTGPAVDVPRQPATPFENASRRLVPSLTLEQHASLWAE